MCRNKKESTLRRENTYRINLTNLNRVKNTLITIEDKLGNIPFFIDRFHEKIKKTDPHKHDDYYELIYLSQGEGFHWIETEQYRITAPEFYFLKPAQMHHWQFTDVPKGYIIMFKASYFDHVRECNILNFCRQLADRFKIAVPSDYSPEYIFDLMLQEFENKQGFSESIINAYLASLIGKMLQLATNQQSEKVKPMNLFDKFADLIFKECPRLHQLQEYASLLNTTSQNINAACRLHSPKSAGEHIDAQLMLEAKRYLLYTEITINEISDMLYFCDASHLVKFFKKYEGITPQQFREQNCI